MTLIAIPVDKNHFMKFGDLGLIPQELVPITQLQTAIAQLTYNNIPETLQKVKSIQKKLPNFDDLANILLDFARIRTKYIRLYAYFIMVYGEKEKGLQASLLETITIYNGPMFRYLYKKEYFNDINLSSKMCNDRKFHYFFIDQISAKTEMNITKDIVPQDFYNKIRKLKNYTKEERSAIYKVGYKRGSIGYYIKIDDLVSLTTKFKGKLPKVVKVCIFEVIKGKIPPIDLAAFYGSQEIFSFLFANGSEITAQTTGLALYSGNNAIFQMCLQKAPNSYSECFLPALQTYRNELFEDILKVKPLDEILTKNIETLVKSKNYGVMWSFFMMGIDINNIEGGNTLLHLAVQTHQYTLANLMLQFLDVQNSSGNSPLVYSLAKGYKNISKLLIENGANVNVRFSLSTLIETAVKYECWETIRYLTSKGAVLTYDFLLTLKNCSGPSRAMILGYPKIDFKNENNTELENAILDNDIKTVQNLIRKKHININTMNDAGYTPFHLAVATKNADACGILLGFGCEINTTNIFGETPLMACCRDNEMFEVFNIMLERGVQINYQNCAGLTALHVAASFDRNEYVGYLIMKGANKDITDIQSKTPADYSNSPLVKSMLSHPAIYNFV